MMVMMLCKVMVIYESDTMILSIAVLVSLQIFEAATPSVVYINTFIETRDAFSMNMLEVRGSG